jgi:hypothetical protein
VRHSSGIKGMNMEAEEAMVLETKPFPGDNHEDTAD